MKMLYEIIKTAKSSDNLICYFLYKQNIDSENISADSYEFAPPIYSKFFQ